MNRAAALALCIGLAMAPAASRADDTYRLCGPGSAGFIRTGKTVACVGGSLDWRKRQAEERRRLAKQPRPQAVPQRPTVAAGSNRKVDEALNGADLAFRDGNDTAGCLWVQNALTADLNDFGGVPSSKEQREQLKRYAARCDLRY